MIHFRMPHDIGGIVECNGSDFKYFPPSKMPYGSIVAVEEGIKLLLRLYAIDDLEYHTTPAYQTLDVLEKSFPDGEVLHVENEDTPKYVPRGIVF